MKRSLLVLIGLLSSTSASFVMLDEPFRECEHFGSTRKDLLPMEKDLRATDLRYQGRSELYFAGYFKGAMVHTYSHDPTIETPHYAALPEAQINPQLEALVSTKFPHHQKIYSFGVQSMEAMEDNVLPHYSLKPQYIMHPHYPAYYNGNVNTTLQPLQWMVVPGVQGNVEPTLGSFQTVGLLSDSVSSHPFGKQEDDVPDYLRLNPNYMVLSGDTMHLKGIHPDHSVDFTSLVAYNDQGKDIVAIQYHWLLNNKDLNLFNDALAYAHSYRPLINTLETIPSFDNLLGELKKYIGMSLELNLQPTGAAEKVEIPELMTITTDHNNNASYQAESNRFPVISGKKIRVPYNVTVEEGGRISLGLLNTQRNGWYGDEIVLGPGHHNDFFERIVPENEKETSLVFRNYHLSAAGQSVFTINDVKLEKEMDEAAINLHLHPTTSPANIAHQKAMRVVTDNNAHASYQLESKRFSVIPRDQIRVSYDITVEEGGKMSLGLLNTQRNGWYGDEVVLGPGHYKGYFDRVVLEGESETSLVFRNYHLEMPGQSTFTINNIAVERL